MRAGWTWSCLGQHGFASYLATLQTSVAQLMFKSRCLPGRPKFTGRTAAIMESRCLIKHIAQS